MTSTPSIVFPTATRPPVLRSDPDWADVLGVEQHRTLPGRSGVCPSAHLLILHLGRCRVGLHAADGTRWVEAAPGSVSIVGAGDRLDRSPGQVAPILAAALSTTFTAAVVGRSGGAARRLRSGAGLADTGLAHVLRALQAELERGCPAGRIYWEALATGLAAQLLRAHLPSRGAPQCGGLPPARLRRVLDHIEAHLHEELCLRDLARIAMLSPSHFSAAFRQSTGMPPYRYALHRRALRAQEMLADPMQPLAEIAYALGYSSQAHFTTMFRKMTGMPPGAYRCSLAENGATVFARTHNDRRPTKDLAVAGL